MQHTSARQQLQTPDGKAVYVSGCARHACYTMSLGTMSRLLSMLHLCYHTCCDSCLMTVNQPSVPGTNV